jgi:ATP-dependent helicase/nuclease subunit B
MGKNPRGMPELVFLRDSLPLVEKAAAWLAEAAPGLPMDLRTAAVAVPTTGASRRLKGELVRRAAERGGGLLPPLLAAPMALLERAGPENTASRTDRLLAWTEILSRARRDRFPALLEGFADHRKPGTALRIARSLTDVATLLAEGGWTPASPELSQACPDDDRWPEFAALHRKYVARLAKAGLVDPDEARIATAAVGRVPAGIRHIVIAGVPDLNRLLQRYLENAEAAGVRVTVLVDAPHCEDARFDGWGCPDVDTWTARHVAPPLEDVHVHGDPASEAEAAVRLLGAAALCLIDTELLPYHERALRGAGREPFNPSGKSLARFECGALAALWQSFCRSRELSVLRALLEQPTFLRKICSLAGLPASGALQIVDRIRTKTLVGSLPDALARWSTGGEAAVLRAAETLRAQFDVAQSLGNFPAFFGDLYEGKKFTPEEAEALDALTTAIQAVLASPLGSNPAAADLLTEEIAATSVYGSHAADAVELHGWLETPWLTHSALVLGGCTEGALPANVTGHPFLPDTLRVRLGLQTNAQRFARDLYLLHTVRAARGPGLVKFTLSRTGGQGDPTRPSRVFFHAPDAELRARVKALFGPVPSLRPAAPRERLWQLDIPREKPPDKLRVTAFGEYLACPFRFYLSRILRMESFDPGKAEMDASDFGTVLHHVVEHFAKSELRDAREAEAIERFVLGDLDTELAGRYGVRLSLPVRVQRESLRARLRQFARLQAQTRREGWRIIDAEVDFPVGDTLTVGNLPVTARIDRVEVHDVTGQRRILDYKTYRSLKGNAPAETHMEPADGSFAEAEFAWDGRQRRWKQLQLPLYRALALRRWPDDPTPPSVGYFLLPEKLEDSGILEFAMDEPLFESALRCADAVADRVRRGVFWPPRDVRYDDFTDLFPDGKLEDAVPAAVISHLQGLPAQP